MSIKTEPIFFFISFTVRLQEVTILDPVGPD